MNRDDILPEEPNEMLYDAHGILVYRAKGKIHVQIANALLEDLTVLQSRIAHCQLSGNYARHAYLSGNQTGTTYALSNTLDRAHSVYNVVKKPVTWHQFRNSQEVRIGLA